MSGDSARRRKLPNSIAPYLEPLLAQWLSEFRRHVRADAVSQSAVRRAAGDWRGACLAAGFDVAVDPAEVRHAYGAQVAGWLQEDLRHLVPDLVRWHLVGAGGYRQTLSVTLATYDAAAGGRTPALWVHTAHRRLELRFGWLDLTDPSTEAHRWDAARYLWDDRQTAGLLRRLGGGDRTPFFQRDGRPRAAPALPSERPGPDDPVALTEWITTLQDAGRVGQAWAASGIEAQLTNPYPGERATWMPERYAMVPALAVALRSWTTTGRADDDDGSHALKLVLPPAGPARHWVTVDVSASAMVADVGKRGRTAAQWWVGRRPVPQAWWRRFPEMELLRLGRMQPCELHPLVRSAMFPDESEPGGYRPRTHQSGVGEFRVRCGADWHRVGWRRGQIDAIDHSPEEARREATFSALGGAVPGCFAVPRAWRDGESLPRQLRDLRRYALGLLDSCDRAGFERLLDAGVDPVGIQDRNGSGPLHLLAGMAGAETLVPRLITAGVDVNRQERRQSRTPLAVTVLRGGSAALVRALLDAGADPTTTDRFEATALHLLHSPDAEMIIPWLLEAGVDLEARDVKGQTPLASLLRGGAPDGAIRAMLAAGADPDEVEDELREGGYLN